MLKQINIDDLNEAIEECKMYANDDCFPYKDKYKNVAEWLEDYKSIIMSDRQRPRKLYAIEEMSTGKIIFNARGGCYKSIEEANTKIAKLGESTHKIITYKLVE